MTVDTAVSFTVTDNQAGDGGGGGIYADGSVSFSSVDSIIFSGNHASTYGGAISAYNAITGFRFRKGHLFRQYRRL